MDENASHPATELGMFGRLPVELRLEILNRLDYGSAIFLAATNKYWRYQVDPVALVSQYWKAVFVTQAELFNQHNHGRTKARVTQPGSSYMLWADWDANEGFGCRNGFCIKKNSEFSIDEKPPRRKDNLRSSPGFCNECVKELSEHKVYSHGPRARVIERAGTYDTPRQDFVWYCEVCEERDKSILKHSFGRAGCQVCHLCVQNLRSLYCSKCGHELIPSENSRYYLIRHNRRNM
ncbi:hypothetical protein HDK77DRAFT_169271 [Phyllosticta capitalensis]|uniref:F-box domain-containing protein n=1 Tax=Phyllosticta capitalensis TaxID=121624 RepID=A0ABR1YS43_9PEZI